MSKSPLDDWLNSYQPDITVQRLILHKLNQQIDKCAVPDCKNVGLQEYSCVFCDKVFCFASHMTYVDLEARYGEAFLEDAMDYPSSEYACHVCVAIIDAEYKLWLEKPQELPRDVSYKKFRF